MTIKFKVEKPEVGIIKAIVYDISGEEEVVAGTVRLVEYNEGTVIHPEPFSVDGHKIGTGSTDIEDHIETVKKAYVGHLEAKKYIEDSYIRHEKLLGFYEVSKEAFLNSGNVRVCINNIYVHTYRLDEHSDKYLELLKFTETKQFSEIPSIASEILLDKLNDLRKAVEKEQKQMNKEIEYLESYK